MSYKIMTRSSNQYIVIKLLPNVTALNNCTHSEIKEYEKLLGTILEPINSALSAMASNVKSLQSMTVSRRSRRFAGVVLAGAALGVATAAQITAGVALHQSSLNAEAIELLRESLMTTNDAIEEIRQASQETIIAVQGIQDYINTELIPAIDQLSCEMVGQKLGLKLLRYYTELLSIFGPSLRDPLSAEISIQALSYAFGGDLQKVIDKLGYSGEDLVAILESKGIRTRVTHVDLKGKFIVLSVSYPAVSEVSGVVVHKLEAVTYNLGAQEWYTAVPRYIVTQGYLISNLDENSCSFVTGTTICSQNSIYPMSDILQRCIRGDTASCARTLVSGTSGNRFILSKGNIIANCAAVLCKCKSSGSIITQSSEKLLTFITDDNCPLVEIDNIIIQVGPRKYANVIYEGKVELGPVIPIEKLDVGTNLGSALAKLDNAKELLRESDKILNMINNPAIKMGRYVNYIVLAGVGLGIITILWCCARFIRSDRSRAVERDHGLELRPELTGVSKSYVRSI